MAAADADAAGAGPEDLVADAVAIAILATCKEVLGIALKEILPPAQIAAYMCTKMGF